MAKLVAVDDIPKGARLVAVEDSKPAGEQLNSILGDVSINNLGRQLGLTARYGLEGVATLPQILGGAMESAGVKGAGSNFGKTISDYIGLPSPQTTQEKVVGEGAKLLAPTGGFIKAGQMLSKSASPVVSRVGDVLKANPLAQATSAIGAGSSGEYVKDTGGSDASQFVAALAGGLAAPSAMAAAKAAPRMAMNGAKSFVEAVAPGVVRPSTTNVDIVIQNVLRDSGVNLSDIPNGILSGLRADVEQASKLGNLSGDSVRRLVDYKLAGATPNRGNLTLNPVQLTQEKNLAKIGANSNDPKLQQMATRINENNSALIGRLNDLGAATSQDSIGAANQVIGAIGKNNEAAQGVINNLYSNARGTQGRSAMLDPAAFTQTANNMLDEALLGGKLPTDVRNLLNKTALGEMPLTVDVAEQFKTRMAALQRASNDPPERMALGQVRTALDNAPLIDGQGQQAIDAFNRARRANRNWMGVVDRTPALQAVRDGVEPDKFVSQYIIGNGKTASVMSVAQLKNVVRNSPEALQAIRGQIVSHIKEKALNGSSDEIGNISQAGLNKAINAIGDRKLKLFFTNQEIAQIKALGRVASYEQVQPSGSAVNNSNTSGATIGTLLNRLSSMPVLNKIPMGQQVITQPLQNISAGIDANQAMNIPTSLVMPNVKKQPMYPSLLIPSLLANQD